MRSSRLNEQAVTFRERVLRGETLYGTFIKTPVTHTTEIIGGLGYDFVLIDAEHASLDRVTTDGCILAARATGTAPMVRVRSGAPEHILGALDDGAYGVMVPHLSSAAVARDVVAACRYAGRRGFSNSPRAGGYGARSVVDHLEQADAEVTVLGMIEDPEGVEAAEEILSVDGLDAVFVGRGDLTAAFRDSAPGAPRVREATLHVIAVARRLHKPVFLLTSGASEAAEFAAMGVSGFVIASDQGFLRMAAGAALKDYRASLK